VGPWFAEGLVGAWEQVLHNFPKFQYCSPVQSLQLPSYDFLHQDHSAYSNDLTPSGYYLFWNLKSDNDGVRYPWWWMTQASFVEGENQFYLMLCDVINYTDVISATNSLEFVKDVRFTDV